MVGIPNHLILHSLDCFDVLGLNPLSPLNQNDVLGQVVRVCEELSTKSTLTDQQYLSARYGRGHVNLRNATAIKDSLTKPRARSTAKVEGQPYKSHNTNAFEVLVMTGAPDWQSTWNPLAEGPARYSPIPDYATSKRTRSRFAYVDARSRVTEKDAIAASTPSDAPCLRMLPAPPMRRLRTATTQKRLIYLQAALSSNVPHCATENPV